MSIHRPLAEASIGRVALMRVLKRVREPETYRRLVCRYISGKHARVGWWREETFQAIDAVLWEVSASGASVLIDQKAPPTDTLYIRLVEDSPTDWTEVHVQKSRRTLRGPTILSVEFEGSCPYAFFRSALPGVSLDS